ncbi:MAG TPA: chalcone isomerase family protein [Myxococcota bacterium]|jgi:hypothetical protein|nr:chalcone isomerase family protein [Myxococcota bacterium]
MNPPAVRSRLARRTRAAAAAGAPPLPLALCAAVALAAAAAVPPAWALDRGADGFYHTGSGIRVKTVAFINVNVYEIHHYMKELPPAKTKAAVIDMDVDKKIGFKMLRDVDTDKIKNAFREGYERNGYTNTAKIDKLLSAFSGDEMTEGHWTSIVYSAATKKTTVTVQGGGTATVDGIDFMKGTWSIWLGKFDQPKLGDALIGLIP